MAAICGSNGDPISYYGMPIRIWFDKTIGIRSFKTSLRYSFDHLASSGRKNGSSSVIVHDELSGPSASLLARCLHAAGAVPRLSLCARVDLEAPLEAINSNIRKSYRSLINWGKRSISLTYVNRDNPDFNMFNLYQELHQRIAGRITRPQTSWDIMFETIAGGGGELSLGRDASDGLISATLVIDGGDVSQYSSGVYDRKHFDKPIGHWPLYDAILRARSRGMSLFELGEVPAAGTASDKEVSIGHFKRGFAGRLDFQLAWETPFVMTGSAHE